MSLDDNSGGGSRIRSMVGRSHKYSKSHYANAEQIVRPFMDVVSFPKPRNAKAPDLENPEAYIEWGEASEFEAGTFRSDASGIGFKVDDNDKPERVRHNLSEEGRATKDYKILSQDDPDAYVIVRNATQIAFGGPGGEQFTFRLNPETAGTQTGSGQTPPAPPSLDEIE